MINELDHTLKDMSTIML